MNIAERKNVSKRKVSSNVSSQKVIRQRKKKTNYSSDLRKKRNTISNKKKYNSSLRGNKVSEVNKPKKGKKFIVVMLIFLIIVPIVWVSSIFNSKLSGLNISPTEIPNLAKAVVDPDKESIHDLEKDSENRTNILLLGVDKREHNDSYLTDTIIIVSFDHETKITTQISLPRDLEITQDNNGYFTRKKINAIFPDAMDEVEGDEKEKVENGFDSLSYVILENFDIDIHYGITVNFEAFKDVIDLIGGITVDVENSFTDYQFPNDVDAGVMTVSFEAGVQQMDGEKALQYARSRKSLDINEGTDFARARRQQKVINAVKDKFLNSSIFSKVDNLLDFMDVIGENVDYYNVGEKERLIAVESREVLSEIKQRSLVVDHFLGSYPEQLLVGVNYDGYYLSPTYGSGDYTVVREHVHFLLDYPALLNEPKIRVIKTADRYNDEYYRLLELLNDKYLKYEKNYGGDGNVFLNNMQSGGSTNFNEETPENNTISLYLSNNEKDGVGDALKQILADNNFKVDIKDTVNMPEEYNDLADEMDVLIVFE